jgi:predicted  nucleic acid-binding Zn-ribbon protein
MECKKLKSELNQWTIHTHEIFHRIGQQIDVLFDELATFREQPSRDAFALIRSKFEGLQESFEKQKRKTESLEKKRDQLASRFKSLNDRIQEVRALLGTDEEGPREVSNGELSRWRSDSCFK